MTGRISTEPGRLPNAAEKKELREQVLDRIGDGTASERLKRLRELEAEITESSQVCLLLGQSMEDARADLARFRHKHVSYTLP